MKKLSKESGSMFDNQANARRIFPLFLLNKLNDRLLWKRLVSVGVSVMIVGALCFSSACSGSKTSSTEPTTDTLSDSSTTSDTSTNENSEMDFEYTDADLDGTWDNDSATQITLVQNGITIAGEGASAQGSVVTIGQAGTYVLKGSLSDGQIIVQADSEDKIKLVLNGVDITCKTGPAIYITQADKVFLTLASSTSNSLQDGSNYTLEAESDEPNAVVFSKDVLTINGTGTLTVKSQYKHAICSKDDLVITGGSYVIEAVEDALRGRDCVKICNGEFSLISGGDGILSNNDTDATRGFVSIDGGSFTIEAQDDGIQAETLLRLTKGTISIDAADDALHSSIEASIEGGTLNISAGDDAVHAETQLIVAGGTIDILSCYEGYEAEKIYINGGTTHISATDDALNAATAELSASESESENEAQRDAAEGGPRVGMREGGGFGASDENCLIEINGGYTLLEVSQGDGIDTNGYYVQNGGTMLVSGPTNNGNGSFDYDLNATINGGYFIAAGSSGMAQNFTEESTQPFAFISFSSSTESNQLLSITDTNDEVLISFRSLYKLSCLLVSSPDMQEGESYNLYLGGTLEDANEDGYASSGALSGASLLGTLIASTTPSGGMGGLAGGMNDLGSLNPGDGNRPGGGKVRPN